MARSGGPLRNYIRIRQAFRLLLYYGAADSVVCGAELSIKDILSTL